MTLAGNFLVLDTSVVIHLTRNDATGREIERLFDLTHQSQRSLISSVTRGEALALALWWGWGIQRLTALDEVLNRAVTVDAGRRPVIDAYARLRARSLQGGRPIGDNDLWIAATCVAVGAELITNDTDFDWLHPAPLVRHYVAPAM